MALEDLEITFIAALRKDKSEEVQGFVAQSGTRGIHETDESH